MKNTNTNTPTASLGAPQANTAPVVKHQVQLDEVDHLIDAPRRYFASHEEERAYYATKEMQETFSGASYSDFNVPPPVDIPVLVNTAPAQAPSPVVSSSASQPVCAPVVSNTQPSPVPAASTKKPIVTLDDCNDWLQLAYADELAELARWGAHVQARAVCSPYEEISPRTAVLITVKDGLVGGAAGPEGELTFTFWDADYPKVELGSITMPEFQDMARRCWKQLPAIQDIYQTRAVCITANLASYVAAYLDVTRASHLLNVPDVGDTADPMDYQWFTGETLPKMDETQNQYPQPKLLALVNAYDQLADDGV